MNSSSSHIITHDGKRPILLDHYFARKPFSNPVVVFCHGYKGFKDWGAWELVAHEFVKAGFDFVKFNFSHNGGTMDNPIDFPDLEAFSLNNYSIELDDLDRVLTFLDQPKVILIGHSRGGGIVLIKAEEDPRISKVISWAGVSDFRARFQVGSPEFESWKQEGIKYIENSRTKQRMPHLWQFFEDFQENEERFTIQRAVRNLSIPQLIIHGDSDPTVSIAEAHQLHLWNPKSRLKEVPGADHVFEARHPWNDHQLPAHLAQVVVLTIDFCR
ncbi:MAG: alpha/beta fold hydrolase [Bacteroidota bacterium]